MAKPAKSPLGSMVRETRAKLGISQHELARVSKVARITIANVELGKHTQIRPSTAYKLARALRLDVNTLLPGTDSKSGDSSRLDVSELLDEYSTIKKGTVVAPTAKERAWLEAMLNSWGSELQPTHASVLFLLLARRHGTK